MAAIIFSLAGWQAVLLCLLFAIIYVGSLYVWSDIFFRDHPKTIKRRFISVGIISLIVPPVIYCFSQTKDSIDAHSILEWLGIRYTGLIPAMILPLLLTMVLTMLKEIAQDLNSLGCFLLIHMFLYLEPRYWTNCFSNLMWIRNHLVAPFSEEFIFRACMLPLLVPAFGAGTSVFLCPLFFGVAHFHHMIEKVITGQQPVFEAFKTSSFQLCYTTVFGAYSAFLFMRTGHVIAPILAHAFCNHMGFPVFGEVMGYQQPTRMKLIVAFIVGLIGWLSLLYPLTSPSIYGNDVYSL
ncbi:hypothetical protein LOTGIDRAFT_111054 [Lottia gigantea]|uniref:CAAX prenyl protease 2 n=1 Tax=Lottia gigantea TaxID=225164 RepID=V4B5T6_LOTGI|nr:hypothetical protein LOTGIDRAFT_111054 [Lottia gigantea]ESP02896.1 hypothetical protein LOTGIDRAFT_111054 [Lottia gigantea]